MTRRRWERLLWAGALLLAAVGWLRWGRALPAAPAADAPVLAAPAPVRAAPPGRLAAASAVVAGNDVFRLDRAPAPLGSPVPGQMVGPGFPGYVPPGGNLPSYTPPGAPPFAGGQVLRVTGISGPPWEALLEGIPGRQGAVVVRPGDRVEDLRIRSITSDLVVVQGQDTTWRLQIKRIGQ